MDNARPEKRRGAPHHGNASSNRNGLHDQGKPLNNKADRIKTRPAAGRASWIHPITRNVQRYGGCPVAVAGELLWPDHVRGTASNSRVNVLKLAETLGVTPRTIQKAIQLFRDDGRLEKIKGRDREHDGEYRRTHPVTDPPDFPDQIIEPTTPQEQQQQVEPKPKPKYKFVPDHERQQGVAYDVFTDELGNASYYEPQDAEVPW
jgi:hypothetical protein